ncbi:hypothetical protein ACQWPW_002847 [Cronobacter sakazakii]|uniref:hypothetical protein n=1 Tax=Cronobacter sakazakii TaxID=28141 RepID=UPI000CF034DD|nr:hypothetical protein [Cronobacter sakazakii]PPY39078.1 hypothetical protein C3D65_10010 [Cronobacter sakazakii]PPY51750.1 hypothetical protein C3D64_04880 [Cronobacter sakazakii]PQY10700.1 hypothetical protein C5956_05310 [Cronobacter sakazakii]PQY32917.1 hypothetical protein C5946_01150 [Cronobacter sakazakii]
MKEFKGTPGPWHVTRGDVLDRNGRMVASVEGFCPGENEDYDADLIAAAPELLEALQLSVKAMQEGRLVSYPEWYGVINKARAAIAKAIGEEE